MNAFTTMKAIPLLTLLLLAAAPLAQAQMSSAPAATVAGTREFTLGASGFSDKRFSGSTGGASGSLGWFLNEASEIVVRQSINFSTGGNTLVLGPTTGTGTTPTLVTQSGRREWSASTRVAYDLHLATRGAFRPFIGANFGGVYGRSVSDTWAAGLEAGGKFYVQPRTFIVALVEYGWFFNRTRNLDDRFRDGQFNWSAGIGFNF